MHTGFPRNLVLLTITSVLSAILLGCGSDASTLSTAPTVERDTTTAAPGAIQTPDESDRETLVAFYHATGGPDWIDNENWLSDKPLNEWHGVVTDELGRVTELRLKNNQWNRTIPPELGQLSELKHLLLNTGSVQGFFTNPLTGEIPAELGNLSNLEELDLGNNELSGGIPSELGQLSNLKFLFLAGNALGGEIPAELGNLANLEELLLSSNYLRGTIPAELGQLSKLTRLNLARNNLSGEIPAELVRLTIPNFVDLIHNDLSEEITAELAQLTNLLLLEMDANSYYELFRELPGGLNQRSYGVMLDELGFHSLDGEVPAELLVSLSYEKVLELWENVLSVRTPAELGQLLSNSLSRVRFFHDSREEMPADLNRLSDLLSTLESLKLAGNNLSGCVPDALRYVENNDFDESGLPFCVSDP